MLLFLLPFLAYPQFRHRKTNQIDTKGQRQGYWVTWQDSVNKIPSATAWFKDGKEHRVSRYYHANGKTRLKLRYINDSLIRVKYFDSTGRLTDKGSALRLYSEKEIRYCWDGVWKQYDKYRHVTGMQVYRKGEEITVLKE
jgi:antitoxin component YwqK of YwqJK toxin-antitoxin module